MTNITVLSVEQLAEFLRKLINGESLSREQLVRVLYTISVSPEADETLLKILTAQDQSEV